MHGRGRKRENNLDDSTTNNMNKPQTTHHLSFCPMPACLFSLLAGPLSPKRMHFALGVSRRPPSPHIAGAWHLFSVDVMVCLTP